MKLNDNIIKNLTNITIVICIIILFFILLWVYSVVRKETTGCQTMNQLYSKFPKISNFIPDDTEQYTLRDYYIKTAYNACSTGNFSNDYVNICALKNCIRQGARCLDFEIYSVDNEPVVATSSVDSYNIKQTFNSIAFEEVIQTINNYAFSGSTSPNPNDPLIIHLRIMSENTIIYDKMANQIYKHLENRVLGANYSYENYGKNLGKIPISDLLGKVVLIVDKSNPLFEKTKLDEYINMSSNSIFMRCSRYTKDIKYAPDINEIIDYNKKNMTICLPDISHLNTNISSSLAMKYGCQMVGMCFQNFDSYMEFYTEFFDSNGSAFVLKPEHLRFIPLTIDKPTPPNPSYSYKTREISSDFYKFNI